MFTLHQTLFG